MMDLRPSRPALCRGLRGTRFEPGHRQRTRAFTTDGFWVSAAYNRKTRRFWTKDPSWVELRADAVYWWTQAPPWPMGDPDPAEIPETRA